MEILLFISHELVFRSYIFDGKCISSIQGFWSWYSINTPIIAGSVVISFGGVIFLQHVGRNIEVVCREVLTPFHGRVGHATGLLRSFLVHGGVKPLQFPGFLPWVSMW